MFSLLPFASASEGADAVDQKMKETTAFKKLAMLRGYEGAWVKARRNNTYYLFNKLLSMGVAFFLATVTLRLKLDSMTFLDILNDKL